MKPNFALKLFFDGIGLLHRTPAGWHLVGEVSLDSTDLAGNLAELARKARALDPTGLRCKLILPPEQIRYLAFDSDANEGDAIEREVRAALDGATPYTLAELSWDWSLAGRRVHVAAVARETLDEAEAFAVEHDFNPLSFVAMPEEEEFVGEPFFGETQHARKVLGPEEAVARESQVVRITGSVRLPEPEPIREKAAPPPDQPASAQPKAPPRAAEPTLSEPEKRPAKTRQQKKKQGQKAQRTAAESDSEAGGAAPAFTSIRHAPADASGAADKVPDLPKARITPSVMKAPRPAQPSPPPAVSGVISGELPADGPGRKRRKKPAPRSAKTTAPPPANRPANRDANRDAPANSDNRDDRDEKERLTIFGARRHEDFAPERPRYLALALTALLLLVLIALAVWASLVFDTRLSRLIFGPAEPARIATRPEPDTTPPPADTASGQTGAPAEPAAETAPATAPAPAPEVKQPASAGDTPASGESPPGESPPAVAQDPEAIADEAIATEFARPQAIPEVLTAEEARRRYAATEIWQKAPEPSTVPGVTELGDVYQTTLDGPVDVGDAIALPAAEAMAYRPPPPRPGNPPPASARFQFDARGFIAATPDGVETPDGVMIYSGPPPVVPPPTPPRATPDTPRDPGTAAPVEPGPRPRLRPDDLTATYERNTLGGRSRANLARLRPRTRPSGTAAPDAPVSGAAGQAVAVSPIPRPRPPQLAVTAPVRAEQRMEASGPTAASVARAATEKNEIALRRISLIGVYGKADSRRALVRLASGSYRKVKVGDRLNGGRVAAIGADQLRYVKGGRMMVLKLPDG